MEGVSQTQTLGSNGSIVQFQLYLPYVLLLFFFQSKFNEDLLKLFVTVINNKLLEAVVLGGEKEIHIRSYHQLFLPKTHHASPRMRHHTLPSDLTAAPHKLQGQTTSLVSAQGMAHESANKQNMHRCHSSYRWGF